MIIKLHQNKEISERPKITETMFEKNVFNVSSDFLVCPIHNVVHITIQSLGKYCPCGGKLNIMVTAFIYLKYRR